MILFSGCKGEVGKVNVLDSLLIFSTFPAHLCSHPSITEVGSLELHSQNPLPAAFNFRFHRLRESTENLRKEEKQRPLPPLNLISYYCPLIFSTLALWTSLLFLKHSENPTWSGILHLIVLLPGLFFPQISTWLSLHHLFQIFVQMSPTY